MGDSWSAWSEEAIYVKMKEPGSGQEQLGGHYASEISDRKLPNRKDW